MYDPPQGIPRCDIPAYLHWKDNLKLIGPNGDNFKRITEMMGLKYLWMDMNKNVIEIYGTPTKLHKAQKYLYKYMNTFFDKHCKIQHSHKKQKV
jgi:hypothetical protein